MQTQPLRPNMAMAVIAFVVLFGILLACARAIQVDREGFFSVSGKSAPAAGGGGAQALAVDAPAAVQATRTPGGPILTPTPDAPHPLPAMRVESEQYTVKPNDTLGNIARQYGVSLEQLIQANKLANPDIVEVGQSLEIPVPTPDGLGPSFKVIPDSELVYGPASVSFNIGEFVRQQGGYLTGYQEEVDGKMLSGAEIVERIADDYSVNPRLLLAALQYQSHWVTKSDPNPKTLDYPLGLKDEWRKGLYRQLAFAADNLNRGFYVWRVNGAATWLLKDGTVIPIDPTINAGTAGVQNLFANLYAIDNWLIAVSDKGLFATYQEMFGYPFDYAVEPMLPPGLSQPAMQLPFEPGREWAFTGGPHGGWGDGSAWAAIDFAPPGDALGCVRSDDWAVAVADGMIVRAGNGAVIQDLDGDGVEQTGWSILYMHIETRDRVQPGTFVRAGERIGHPSCEGGISTGTHMHLARKYNGEWISADQDLPFVLDGWTSRGDGNVYDGFLVRDGEQIEAYAGRSSSNGIRR